MTGTGTQADPLVIMNADDLYALETAGGSGKYAKLGANIDFNGTQYADDFQPIPLNCTYFDGNGKTIRNIYKSDLYTDPAAFRAMQSTVNITSLKVENLVMRGDIPALFTADTSGTRIYMTRCDVALDVTLTGTQIRNSSTSISDSSSVFKSKNVVNVFFTLCSLTVRGTMLKLQPLGLFCGFTSTMVYLDLKYSVQQSYSEGTIAPFIRGDCTDCGFLGDIEYTGGGTTLYCFPAWGGSHYNCYSAITFTNISRVYWDSAIRSPFIWKTTGNSGVTVYNDNYGGNNIKQLTLEQMKDAAALRSVGFDVVG